MAETVRSNGNNPDPEKEKNHPSPFLGLAPTASTGAKVEQSSPGFFRLYIPGGLAGSYRFAQLDDYAQLNRKEFPWKTPCSLEIKARVSAKALPGTWGFGFWNDPFAASQGLGGMLRRRPALPNAGWFFYASPPNYLAFQDDHPAQGFLAAFFSSPHLPALLMAPGLLALPLLTLRPAARLLRRLASSLIIEDSVLVPTDPTQWQAYRVELTAQSSRFFVNGKLISEFPQAPRGALGLVVWIDNQFAAFTPDGRLKSGTLPNPPSWLEIDLNI